MAAEIHRQIIESRVKPLDVIRHSLKISMHCDSVSSKPVADSVTQRWVSGLGSVAHKSGDKLRRDSHGITLSAHLQKPMLTLFD